MLTIMKVVHTARLNLNALVLADCFIIFIPNVQRVQRSVKVHTFSYERWDKSIEQRSWPRFQTL